MVCHYQRRAAHRGDGQSFAGFAASGTSITLTAVATGGSSVNYQFWAYNPNVTPAWSQLQPFTSLNTCTWKPNVAGNYLLSVTARDDSNNLQVNSTCWYLITNGTPLTAVSLTASPASPQPANTPITLTAKATGGTDVQYQFWVYNPNAPRRGRSCRPIAAQLLYLDAGHLRQLPALRHCADGAADWK